MLSKLAFYKMGLLYRNMDKGAVKAEHTGAEGHDYNVCQRQVLHPSSWA